MVGSSLFALGAVPWYAEAVGLRATAVTFFVGSLFFTSAAFLQYRQAVDALAPRPRRDRGRCSCGRPATSTGWPAPCSSPARCGSTGAPATRSGRTSSAAAGDQRVWRPDVLGSIAFLVASALACVAVHRAGEQRRAPLDGLVDRRGQHDRVRRLRRLGRSPRSSSRPTATCGTPSCPTSARSSARCASWSARRCSCPRPGGRPPDASRVVLAGHGRSARLRG